jgi:hypothetical protein
LGFLEESHAMTDVDFEQQERSEGSISSGRTLNDWPHELMGGERLKEVLPRRHQSLNGSNPLARFYEIEACVRHRCINRITWCRCLKGGMGRLRLTWRRPRWHILGQHVPVSWRWQERYNEYIRWPLGKKAHMLREKSTSQQECFDWRWRMRRMLLTRASFLVA